MNMQKARAHAVAILSPQMLFRQGLAELLRRQGFAQVSEYESSQALLQLALTAPPDVLIVDLDHAQNDTWMLLRTLQNQLPHTHLIIIGSALRQEAAVPAARVNGLETPDADMQVLAAAAALVRMIPSSARRQQRHLWSAVTPRQRDVLRWLSIGVDNQTIARRLKISERAVKGHLSALLERFGVENRTQLALIADHAGLKPPRVCAAV